MKFHFYNLYLFDAQIDSISICFLFVLIHHHTCPFLLSYFHTWCIKDISILSNMTAKYLFQDNPWGL